MGPCGVVQAIMVKIMESAGDGFLVEDSIRGTVAIAYCSHVT